MRSSTIRSETLPLELQQQIDACCDKFEAELKQGGSVEVTLFLNDMPAATHLELRREFAAIELAYQRTKDRGSEGLHLRCPHCQNQVELLDEAKLEEITCNSCGDTFSLIDEDATNGGVDSSQRVGHFELVTRLGTGGFGSVWEARDTELDRLVALKIPRKSQLSTREAEQFFREARTAAQLKHPHIVPVHEVGKEGATIFIVTDLIRGVTMSDWMKAARPTTTESVQLCATLAEALSYAHSQGVIHRDLKPSNVMLDEEQQPHIMDFGLAKRELGEITMTVDGTILGTPAYMSPEQALGQMHWVDRRTDVYSLGVMLFQMLTGELPYRGTAQQQIQQRIADDAPDPRKLNAHVPADLATICLKCLERDANRRFNNADEVASELRCYLAGEPIKSRPISSMNRLLRWAQRKPTLAALAVLTTVLAIAGPIASVTILRDKRTIEKQLAERNEIILREKQDNDQLDRELQAARQQLASLQQANPGIQELSQWHKTLINEFVKSNQPARQQLLAQAMSSKSDELEQQARTHLGWNYLLNATGQQAEATRHGELARNGFRELVQNDSNAIGARVLLAESLGALSAAQQKLGQREKSLESINEAVGVLSSLSAQHPEELRYQLDHFYSSGKRLGIEQIDEAANATRSDLKAWAALKQKLSQQLTVDSQDLYALACYLTRHEPHLRDDLAPVATGQVLEERKVD